METCKCKIVSKCPLAIQGKSSKLQGMFLSTLSWIKNQKIKMKKKKHNFGKKWTRALWPGEKNSGLIQGYLMSIQESHNKTNDIICILASSLKKLKKKSKWLIM